MLAFLRVKCLKELLCPLRVASESNVSAFATSCYLCDMVLVHHGFLQGTFYLAGDCWSAVAFSLVLFFILLSVLLDVRRALLRLEIL